jgi:hypothetical protein
MYWRLTMPKEADIALAHRDFLLNIREDVRTTAPSIHEPVCLAFDSREVGLKWLQSRSLTHQLEVLNQQVAWLTGQRTHWMQKTNQRKMIWMKARSNFHYNGLAKCLNLPGNPSAV